MLQLQADYNRRVNPILYFLKLVLGLIFVVISIIWIIHMYPSVLTPSLESCTCWP